MQAEGADRGHAARRASPGPRPDGAGLYTSGDAWWYKALNQSYTWAGAESWSWFAPKRTVALSRVYDMTVADVLQYDLTKNGTMDHTMFVRKKTTTDIYMTYHTTDHNNRPRPAFRRTGMAAAAHALELAVPGSRRGAPGSRRRARTTG